MFLSALQTYIVAILISVIVVQYAFALFFLLKLSYFDLPKTHYILWNLCILVVFFIGGAAFLVYYYKHPEKRIQKLTDAVKPDAQAEGAPQAEQSEQPQEEQAEKDKAEEEQQQDSQE